MPVSLPIWPPAPRPVGVTTTERVAPRAVRLSITDRCDLACVYCRPGRRDGYLPSARRLDARAWQTLVEVLVDQGVRRVRLTGGEPLVHPEVLEIVDRIAAIPGVEDLALTTNGTLLQGMAKRLVRAGLRRINVSLDSLDPNRFFRLTRGGRLQQVLDGIAAARDAGVTELKLNTVALRGENEHELAAIAAWAFEHDVTPRFLELMGVGQASRLKHMTMPYGEIRACLSGLLTEDEPVGTPDRGPARYVSTRDGGHRVGFITGASDSFCLGCDRLRVTSDGHLRPCLARSQSVDVSAELRGDDRSGIARRVAQAWSEKPNDALWRGCGEDEAGAVDMRATGG